MSKGGGSTSTSREVVTQQADIPDFLKPFVRRQAQVGTGALNQLNRQLTGAGADELVAPFTGNQLQSQQLAANVARGAGGFIPAAQNQFLQTARGQQGLEHVDPAALAALQQTAGGEFLFGGQGFNEALDAASRAANANVASVFGGAGRGTGGLAQAAIGQGTSDAFARLFGDERMRQLQASSALGQLGEAERQRQLQAAGALPGLGLLPSDILGQVGAERQAQAQRQLTAPLSAQETLLSAAGGGIPLGSLIGQSGSSQAFQPRGSSISAGLSGGLGGALTGAALGSVIPGLGTGLGAALGGGTGLFGGLLS